LSERPAAATTTRVEAAITSVISTKAAEKAVWRSHTATTPKKVKETAAGMLSLVLAKAKIGKRSTAERTRDMATCKYGFKN